MKIKIVQPPVVKENEQKVLTRMALVTHKHSIFANVYLLVGIREVGADHEYWDYIDMSDGSFNERGWFSEKTYKLFEGEVILSNQQED